jgi:hypothetical protein
MWPRIWSSNLNYTSLPHCKILEPGLKKGGSGWEEDEAETTITRKCCCMGGTSFARDRKEKMVGRKK